MPERYSGRQREIIEAVDCVRKYEDNVRDLENGQRTGMTDGLIKSAKGILEIERGRLLKLFQKNKV